MATIKPVYRPRLFPLVLAVAMWASIIGGIVALTGCGGGGGLTPRPLLADARVVVLQAADSLEVTMYYTLGGNVASVDSVGAFLEVPTGIVVKRIVLPAAVRNFVTFRRIRPEVAITGRICVSPLYVKTVQVAGTCLTWGYVPPTVAADSIHIAHDVRVLRPDGSLYATYRLRPGDALVDSTRSRTERLMTGAQFCWYTRFGRGRLMQKPGDAVERCKQDFHGAYLALRT